MCIFHPAFLVIVFAYAFIASLVSIITTHPESTQDLLINQELLPVKHSSIRSHYASYGKSLMAQSSVTIMGVGRNLEHRIPSIMKQVDGLCSYFKYSQAIFVEGASSDNSLPLLIKWANVSNHNRSIYQLDSMQDYETDERFKTQFLSREGRIAKARNLTLEKYRSSTPTDYIIVLDLDIIGWTNKGVQDSFGQADKWDAICAHGISLHGIYRDIYALRTDRIDTNHHKAGSEHELYNITENRKQKNRKKLWKAKSRSQDLMGNTFYGASRGEDLDLIKVDSCFGGLTIYKSQILNNCFYSHRHSEPPFILDCEHVLLHDCVAKQNHGRILSNPKMKLWYGHTNITELNFQKIIKGMFQT